tara:strand:+ start:391 stop:882 length:492 start_codon:yes stop_codon:yes gene_type:complete
MPAIEITDSKGLVQKTGSGIEINSKGAIGTVSSAATSLIATGANTEDISVSVPANALIVDAGVVITTAIALNTGADITCAVGVGAAGNADLSASANLASSVTAVPINTAFHTSQANEATGLLAFKVTAPVYRTAATDVFFRVGNSANNVTAGEVKVFVRYLIV